MGGGAAPAYILVNLAAVDRAEGDFARAGELIEESLARFQRARRHAGGGLRAQRARQPGPLQRRLRARAGAARRGLALRQEVGDRRGTGITLGCLAVLLARSGDPAGGRAAAERARGWFAENDDLIGLSAAELSLANVALCDGDRATPRAHLEAAASVFGGIESMHQAGWALAVLGGDVGRGRRTGGGARLARAGDAALRARWAREAGIEPTAGSSRG